MKFFSQLLNALAHPVNITLGKGTHALHLHLSPEKGLALLFGTAEQRAAVTQQVETAAVSSIESRFTPSPPASALLTPDEPTP